MLDINGILSSIVDVSDRLLIGADVLGGIFNGLLSGFIAVSMWVLSLVKVALRLIFDIVELDFFTQSAIGELSERIYIILGVIMLFKITISCIQYMINPDKTDDKENGFGSIAFRTIGAVALLAFTPAIFTFAKTAETAIAEALPKVITGKTNNLNVEDIGEDIAYSTALGFFGYSNPTCNDGSIAGLPAPGSNDTIVSSGAKFSSIKDIMNNSDIIVENDDCYGNNRYSFNWLCIFVAGFLVFILFSMAVDVAIRTIKFGFLQLIAPIPIASFIDPKTSKKSFDSWVHNSITIYIDLFVRLGVIYLVLYIFELFTNSFISLYTTTGYDVFRASLLSVAIIIALFVFAKNAPKFITDVLGIKGDGNIGDMFKRAGGFAGAGLGALKAGVSNYKTQKARLGSKNAKAAGLRAALSAVAGAGSAQARGMYSSLRGKGFGDTYRSSFSGAIKARDARNERVDSLYNTGKDAKADGSYYGKREYISDKFNSWLGVPDTQSFIKQRYDLMEKIGKGVAEAKSHGVSKMNETPARYQVGIVTEIKNEAGEIIGYEGKDTHTQLIYDAFKKTSLSMAEIRRLDSQIASGATEVELNGKTVTVNSALAEAINQTVQSVEKRTSYLKEAELMMTGDPASTTFLNRLLLDIKANPTMFTDPEILKPIQEKFAKYGFDGITSSDKLLQVLKQLDKKEVVLKDSDGKVWEEPKREDFATAAEYEEKKLLWQKAYDEAYEQLIGRHADLLNAAKDAFEEVTKQNYTAAQAADFRSKKTKQATQNDKK